MRDKWQAACVVFLIAVCGSAYAHVTGPYRPLVFIPGILGSELLDENDNLVWGGASSLAHFDELEITETGSVKRLHTGGLVKNISILGPFWAIHQYDGLLDTLQRIGFREGENLFVFPYDWRYSNFDTAQKLKDFIDIQPKLQGQQFDILAHSMGGLAAKIYIQTLGGAPRVKRLISLAVPSRGSMNAVSEMAEGWGGFENFIAGGISTIRRVM